MAEATDIRRSPRSDGGSHKNGPCALCKLRGEATSEGKRRITARRSKSSRAVARNLFPRSRASLGVLRLRFPARLSSQHVLEVLLRARELLCARGWVAERGRFASSDVLGRITVLDAVLAQAVTIHRHHARQVLEALADNELSRWNRHPLCSGAAAVELVDRAISELGGVAPSTRYQDPHRPRAGGWSVSSRRSSR